MLGLSYYGLVDEANAYKYLQQAVEQGFEPEAEVTDFLNNYQTRKLSLNHTGKKKEIKKRFLYYMAHGLDGALVGYMVSGFFVTVLYYPYFWINMAMTVSLNAVARKQNENKTI